MSPFESNPNAATCPGVGCRFQSLLFSFTPPDGPSRTLTSPPGSMLPPSAVLTKPTAVSAGHMLRDTSSEEHRGELSTLPSTPGGSSTLTSFTPPPTAASLVAIVDEPAPTLSDLGA